VNKAAIVQALVIAAIVAWSTLVTARKLLPTTMRRAQARLADALAHSHAPAWLRARAARWQPKSTTGGSCSDGCSSCGGCASASSHTADTDALPLTFRPKSSPAHRRG